MGKSRQVRLKRTLREYPSPLHTSTTAFPPQASSLTVTTTIPSSLSEVSEPDTDSVPPTTQDPGSQIPEHRFGEPNIRHAPSVAANDLTGLCEYSIAYLRRLDILGTLSDEETAQISRIDSRDNLLLQLPDTLRTQSADRVEGLAELAEEFVCFVQTVAQTDWRRLPRLSQQLQAHTETLKRLLCIGVRQYGGQEVSGYRFFVAILAWDAILTNLTTLAPNNGPTPQQILVTVDGAGEPLDTRALPRLLPQRSADPEASATLEKIDASLRDVFASGELEEFAVTITEYGFGPSLTVPVILMWSHHLPECLSNLSTPTILRRYNLSLGSGGVASTPTPIGAAPPLPPPRFRGLPVATGSPARDSALGILYGDATSSAEKSERLGFRNMPAPADNEPRVPLGHGSNISCVGSEKRGSLGVFLAPLSRPTECHFLSAQHVFSGSHESQIQTFSHLDTLRKLAIIVYSPSTIAEQETQCDLVQQQVQPNVATLIESSIGTDDQGWREDWAVCRVSKGYCGVNGSFTTDQDGSVRRVLEVGDYYAFQGGMGVKEAKEGDTVFKMGATTGASRGIVNRTKVFAYRKGTAEPASDGDIPYDSANSRLILRDSPSDTPFCAGGDSGAAVFVCEEGKLFWVGLLVGIDHAGEIGGPALHDDIGIMIPQDIILSQVERKTGTKWGLYQAPLNVQ